MYVVGKGDARSRKCRPLISHLKYRGTGGYGVAVAIQESSGSLLLHRRSCEVEDVDGNVYPIRPGDMYALDNSPLRGTERHTLDGASGSTH